MMAEMTIFYVAGYLIEERKDGIVFPRGHYSKSMQNLETKAYSDEKTVEGGLGPLTWLD